MPVVGEASASMFLKESMAGSPEVFFAPFCETKEEFMTGLFQCAPHNRGCKPLRLMTNSKIIVIVVPAKAGIQ